MPEVITGSGSATDAGTAGAGNAQPESNQQAQESKATDPRLAELEAKASRAVQLEAELESQKKRATELERNLKQHQANTTAKLQEAADLRRRLERENQLMEFFRGEISEVKAYQQQMAEALLEEEQRKNLETKMRETRLSAREEALKRQAQAAQQAQQSQAQTVDPELYRQQLWSTYASDSSLDINDPRIDWAGDARSLQEWLPRFRRSVQAAERETVTKRQEELLSKAREEAAEAAKKAAEEARDQARREHEERLRAAGANVPSLATPETQGNRRMQQELDEDLPDDLLYSNPKEYQKRLAEKSRKIRGF